MAEYKKYTDNELCVLLARDNEQAFAEIYHRYKVKMISASLRVLKSSELTEELVQNLFVKLWEHRHTIDPNQSLNAYLYKIAQNMAFDVFRKAARDKKMYEQLLLATSSSYEHIEKYIFAKESQSALNEAISLLPPQQQKVFILCKLEDKSYEEAGRLLNISTGTINNHLYRANLFLKQHFSKASNSQVTISLLLCSILGAMKPS